MEVNNDAFGFLIGGKQNRVEILPVFAGVTKKLIGPTQFFWIAIENVIGVVEKSMRATSRKETQENKKKSP
jgi:hypothetical protein